jgi:hypothetical protein
MLMNLLGKSNHRPYLALRAPAQKMIRRKQLPSIEELHGLTLKVVARKPVPGYHVGPVLRNFSVKYPKKSDLFSRLPKAKV